MSLSLTFTPDAHIRVGKMKDRCWEIGNHYGSDSREYREAVKTLMVALVAMIGLAGKVSADAFSDLSLYCRNEFIDYGVTFFPTDDGGPGGTWSVDA